MNYGQRFKTLYRRQGSRPSPWKRNAKEQNGFVFLSEYNRMGKTRNLFKKIRDTKGIFHAKMGLIKDRNGLDLTEAEILRRGGKNTQNYTNKIFMTQIITTV